MTALNPPRQGRRYDAVIVGSGPNGLAAAITLAKAGKSVLVLEGHDTIGGGCRSAELLMPGVIHDVCSAIHPLVVASPFLKRLDVKLPGVTWIGSPAWLAHPFDDGTAVAMRRSVVETAIQFGEDAAAYCDLITPLLADAGRIISDQLGPLR
ncbi:MAG TPA: FAD-dependent oxidoreductase, partial [Thermomicrobiaceae bacterium]|nr:FAD-dependent oxidoreductase [Thermomicrobiaceae bacterium]